MPKPLPGTPPKPINPKPVNPPRLLAAAVDNNIKPVKPLGGPAIRHLILPLADQNQHHHHHHHTRARPVHHRHRRYRRDLEDDEELSRRDLEAEELFGREYDDFLAERDFFDDLD